MPANDTMEGKTKMHTKGEWRADCVGVSSRGPDVIGTDRVMWENACAALARAGGGTT